MNDMDQKMPRRDVLQRGAAGVLALAGLGACKESPKTLSCADTTNLSAADAQVRTSLAYVDHSTEPGKACNGCQQFIPAAPDTCGGCKIIKGTINPAGYCKSFVAKT
jgi:hypothetical protein